MRHAHFAFLVLGCAFLAIGLGGQRSFIYSALVFFILAFRRWRRASR